jgi:hypothetical protein
MTLDRIPNLCASPPFDDQAAIDITKMSRYALVKPKTKAQVSSSAYVLHDGVIH